MTHRTWIMALALLVLALSSTAAAAPCTSWDAALQTSQKTGLESVAIHIEWSGYPVACTNTTGDDWDGTDHLEVHVAAGTSTPPSTPSAGTLVVELAPASPEYNHFVHRSYKMFAHRVFACEDAGCTSWYGDGSGSLEGTSNTGDSQMTALEKFELIGITGESDITSVIVDDNDANAPHAFFYPSGWGWIFSGKLAMYYSKGGDSSDASEIYWMLHDSTGWPTLGFNDSTYWDSPDLVAEGSTDDSDDDYAADHPWAMLTRDGSDNRVQLFVQSQLSASGSHNQAIQIESSTFDGQDFGLTCSGSACTDHFLDGDGTIAVAADATSSTAYLDHVRHSRVGWDHIADPYIDAGTDEPFMMIQVDVQTDTGEPCHGDGGPSDLGRADGTWDTGDTGTDPHWEWTVEVDGDGCPEIHVADGHDNALIPLPDGEFKMYYKVGTDQFYVSYWNGEQWEDTREIEFVWDGSASGPDHECIDNVSAVLWASGPDVRQALFFMLQDSDTCGVPGGGLDDDPRTDKDDGAIVYAELAN